MNGSEILTLIQDKFPEALISHHDFRGDTTFVMQREVLHQALEYLRQDPALDFDFLVDVCGVDNQDLNQDPRFEVVYHLSSSRFHHRLRLRFPVPEADPIVPTVTDIWVGANWFEREVYDMFGIKFLNHPNLRRILTHEDFGGHPLRKDYPVNRRPSLHPLQADILTHKPFKG